MTYNKNIHEKNADAILAPRYMVREDVISDPCDYYDHVYYDSVINRNMSHEAANRIASLKTSYFLVYGAKPKLYYPIVM